LAHPVNEYIYIKNKATGIALYKTVQGSKPPNFRGKLVKVLKLFQSHAQQSTVA